MFFATDYRASSIIYNFLNSNDHKKGHWIIPTNVCHFVPATVLKTGAQIELLDVDVENFCLNEELVLSKIKGNKKKYSGIIYVRGFGVENNAISFFEEIKNIDNNLLLIDDKCLSKPSINDYIEPFVDMALYSTGYAKYLDFNKGGFAKINDKLKYNKSIKEYDSSEEDEFSNFFRKIIFNDYKINEQELVKKINGNWLKTEIINAEKYFSEINSRLLVTSIHKEKINKIYESIIPATFKFGDSHNNWRFTILVNNKKDVMKKLQEANLFSSSHYYSLSKIFPSNSTPVWDNVYDKIINLFNDFRYTETMAKQTSEIIAKYGK